MFLYSSQTSLSGILHAVAYVESQMQRVIYSCDWNKKPLLARNPYYVNVREVFHHKSRLGITGVTIFVLACWRFRSIVSQICRTQRTTWNTVKQLHGKRKNLASFLQPFADLSDSTAGWGFWLSVLGSLQCMCIIPTRSNPPAHLFLSLQSYP